MTILAAHAWPNNAELILAVHRLGYITDRDRVLDPTYGRGLWWTRWRPQDLTTHDRKKDGSDFRDLSQYPDGWFTAIAFDPPYVAKGGRSTSGMKEMDDRYGQDDCPATPALLQELINDGMTEMTRMLARKGTLIVKCQNYISSGQFWPGVNLTIGHAHSLGLKQVDQFEHVGSVRPQPKRTRKDGKPVLQHHARRNVSTLLIFKKL